MRLIDCPQYIKILNRLYDSFPHWGALNGKTVLISGASGMIGSLMVDAIMMRNMSLSKQNMCKVIALGRNETVAELRFEPWLRDSNYVFISCDVSDPFCNFTWKPDYLIHAASTTHPLAYLAEPVNTILTNILGTRNLLDLTVQSPGSRFLLLSSVEVYGENRGDIDCFKEDYCGYLDCNSLRAGYPEGKRASEALCQAYIQQYETNIAIIRLPRTYGPTMRMSDSKANAQFIKKGIAGENIVLKSKGDQFYSYAYVADVVLGILWVLICGEQGMAYNLSDSKSDISLKGLAEIVAAYAGTKVIFELPDETEKKGYSTATKAIMDAGRLRKLGWTPQYDIHTGIRETMDILQILYK